MSTLAQQNILNIDTICTSANETASRYDRKSFIFLQITWILWMLITAIGIAITVMELINSNNKIVNVTLALSVSTIGMIQSKFKLHKTGYMYKNSASKTRKLGRSAQKLKWSKLSPEEVAIKLEEIYEDMDDIELEIYSTNESSQGTMREGFGEGPKIISNENTPLKTIKIDDMIDESNQKEAK